MIRSLIITIILSISLIFSLPVYSQEGEVFFREEFSNLDNWEPLHFPKIKKHTSYSIVNFEGEGYLKADSDASASGIVLKKEFNVFKYPKVKWRWEVSNVYERGNAREKTGDDYPMRVYIIFEYNPENASFVQRIKYGLAKQIYGEYPPHSSLNYIWANKKHDEKIITNTYADEAKMIILRTGSRNTGKWFEEEVNLIEDYHKAFGEDPPAMASVAIMNDSDNTGESSVSYIDYIEVFR